MVVVVGLLIPKLSELTKGAQYPKYRNKPGHFILLSFCL